MQQRNFKTNRTVYAREFLWQ